MNPECTHVKQNSGLTQYSFTLTMGTCGTQFISDFEGESGQAYLENVLVLQVGVELIKIINLILQLFLGYYLTLACKKHRL